MTLWLLGALSAWGCRAEAPAPLDAELLGCGARFDDGRCALPVDRALRVFVPGASERALTAWVDDTSVGVEAAPVEGGVLLRLVVPEGPVERLRVDAAKARAVFALEAPEPGVDGDRAALEALLPGASAQMRGLILARLARLHLRAGEVAAAEARFVEAEAAHRAVGRRSAVLRDLEARVFAA